MPPAAAPTPYAHSFVRISGTPIRLAASSSSRIASQARPSLPSRRRSEITTNSTQSAKIT